MLVKIMGVAKKQKGHGDTSSDTAVSLKKGDFTTPPQIQFFKRKRRLEMQYFKTAILRRKAEFNGLVVSASTVATKKKRADKPFAYWLRVIGSASVRLALLQS